MNRRPEPAAPRPVAGNPCPTCGGATLRAPYGDKHIDACSRCGSGRLVVSIYPQGPQTPQEPRKGSKASTARGTARASQGKAVAREAVSGPQVREVWVAGVPVPQPRWGTHGDYRQPRVKAWRSLIIRAASEAGWEPSNPPGGWCLSIEFRVSRPARTKEEYPTRGDLDNLIKAVKDALNGVAWDDDRHVRRYGEMAKEWADSRGPGVRIVVETARRGEE